MSSAGATPDRPPPTVFLSYASEDREAARRIGDALPGYGLEVWYDESELGGGDAWDQKIRRQIRDCDYFMALVSARTEARHEGYFRREWRLAVERTLDMADDHLFLLPVAIDDTNEAAARVPEKFLSVQWLRVPGGEPTAALEALCRRLVSGETAGASPNKKAFTRATQLPSGGAAGRSPEFPREEPGQKMRFWLSVIGWALRSGWAFFMRLPRWIRIAAYIWIGVVLLSKGCTPGTTGHHPSADISPATAQKLKAIADQYKGSTNKADIARLGAQVAREFSDDPADSSTEHSALLAIPFTAPAGDTTAAALADATFAQVYGRVSISHSGHVGLSKDPLPSGSLAAAVERGRANHSNYVMYGTVEGEAAKQTLIVNIATIADGSVLWSQAYATAGADPAKIAADVDSRIPVLEDD